MTIVNIEDIRHHLDAIAAFDALELGEIELHEGGRPIDCPAEAVAEFHFLGLCNSHFVEMRLWEDSRFLSGIGVR